MGYQIIPEDHGTFALFCSNTDRFVERKLSRGEIVEFFVEIAAQRATDDVVRIFEKLATGERPYFQFTLTLDEAIEKHAAATKGGAR